MLKAQDFDDALRIANGTRYALTGGVYSRSPANLRKARAVFEVGNLYLNRSITGAMIERHPFGGFKMPDSPLSQSFVTKRPAKSHDVAWVDQIRAQCTLRASGGPAYQASRT